MKSLRRYVPLFGAAGLVVVIQLVLSGAGYAYFMTQITMAAYYALVVIGLCLLMGYAGQASLGHAGFFAIGGYTSAVLTTYNLIAWRDAPLVAWGQTLGLVIERQDLYGRDIVAVSPWLALAVALVATTAVAFLIGLPLLRLKGHYLAMATLGFGLIVLCVVQAAPLFGGADGVSNVPPLALPLGLQVNGRAPFRVQNYYLAWAAVLAAMVLAINLVQSRVGRALRSIHQSEEAAQSLGVDTYRYKLYIFVTSAVLAAAGGVLLTHYKGSIAPGEATVMKSVSYVAIVAVGGMDNLWGALAAGVILKFISLRGVFGSYDDTVFGAILVCMMILAPRAFCAGPTGGHWSPHSPANRMDDTLLETRGLNRFFGGLHAVKDVTLSVRRGMIKAVIGPNGAGKTTLFNLIAGTLAPHGGQVFFRGRPITGRRPHAVARLGIARTFQTTKLFGQMTVLENVMMGRHARTRSGFLAGMLNLPGTGREDRQAEAAALRDPRRTWAWRTTPTTGPRACRSAASGWSSSPGPWPWNRRCSSWTSRPQASTSTRRGNWRPSSRRSASAASPASSSSTTCRWSWTYPMKSSSWTRARRPPRGRRTTSSGTPMSSASTWVRHAPSPEPRGRLRRPQGPEGRLAARLAGRDRRHHRGQRRRQDHPPEDHRRRPGAAGRLRRPG